MKHKNTAALLYDHPLIFLYRLASRMLSEVIVHARTLYIYAVSYLYPYTGFLIIRLYVRHGTAQDHVIGCGNMYLVTC
jgi:hypothetical protein